MSAARSLGERLFDAVAKGDAAAVGPLLAEGADPAWENPLAGNQTPLGKALEAGNPAVVEAVFRSAVRAKGAADAVVEAVRRHAARPSWGGGEEERAAGEAAATVEEEAEEEEAARGPLEARVEAALAAFARGEFLVVTDNEDRENEGDLVIGAEHVTPEKMAFLVRHTSGIVCVATTAEALERLELPQMVTVKDNTESHGTAFTVSVDYLHGTTTGISAADRAITVRAFADPAARPHDFARPGHIFPLRARPGGVLERGGHTEAAVDLARLSGLATHAGAISEIVRDDGRVARRAYLRRFAKRNGLLLISVDDLARYREATGK